jgi:hypothetical protein
MTINKAKICDVTDVRILSKLTSDAEVVCARCGAKAHNKANVCDPAPFEPDH